MLQSSEHGARSTSQQLRANTTVHLSRWRLWLPAAGIRQPGGSGPACSSRVGASALLRKPRQYSVRAVARRMLCCAALCCAALSGGWAHRSRATCRAAGVFGQHAVVTQVTPQVQLQSGVIVQGAECEKSQGAQVREHFCMQCIFSIPLLRRRRRPAGAGRARCMLLGCLAEPASCNCGGPQASEPAPAKLSRRSKRKDKTKQLGGDSPRGRCRSRHWAGAGACTDSSGSNG